MTEEEKEAIENLGGAIGRRDCTDLYWKDADIIYDLIQKQDTEINKLNKVINYMVGEIDNLNYETIGKWCTQDKGNKCENCDNNNYECIKEYFLKEE